MRCQACGSAMEEKYRSREKDRIYIWYACRHVSCQQEMLHVTTESQSESGQQLAGQI